ncbi:MAG: trigger factor [Eubacteriales bacterium]
MSLKSKTEPVDNKVELEILIDKGAFDAAVTEAYRKNAAKLSVPGFRKGKAPRAIVEKMYGKDMFYEDALNTLLPTEYEAAVKEAGIEPVSRPEMDVTSIDDNGVAVKASVYVKPEIELEAYKGLKVEKPIYKVSEEDVASELEKVRKRNARMISVTERPAENGDTAVFDFEGFADGVPFEGGKAEKHSLVLGSGQFIPGFEEQIVGKSIDEEFDVNVSFPEEYHAEELKGKPAVFKCKLHEIKREELPELDDEFAKDASEFNTLDEYKADIKSKLEASRAKAADSALDDSVFDALLAGMKADIPSPMLEAEIDQKVQDYEYRLSSQGLNLETFFQYTGQTMQTMREQFAPQAERSVKIRLALEKIATLENIVPSEEELDVEYGRLADAYKMEVDKIKMSIDKSMLEKDIAVHKAFELVKSAAEVTEVEGKDAAHSHVHDHDECEDEGCDCHDHDHE